MIPWNLGSSILRGAILQSMVTARFSLSILIPGWGSRSAAGAVSEMAAISAATTSIMHKRNMGWPPSEEGSFFSEADHSGRLAGVGAFQVAGGNEDPAAVHCGAGVNHAGGFDVGMRCQIDGPLRLAVCQAQRVHHATQITCVHDSSRHRRRSEERRLAVVDPAAFAAGQVEGTHLAVGCRGDGEPVGQSDAGKHASGKLLAPLLFSVREIESRHVTTRAFES